MTICSTKSQDSKNLLHLENLYISNYSQAWKTNKTSVTQCVVTMIRKPQMLLDNLLRNPLKRNHFTQVIPIGTRHHMIAVNWNSPVFTIYVLCSTIKCLIFPRKTSKYYFKCPRTLLNVHFFFGLRKGSWLFFSGHGATVCGWNHQEITDMSVKLYMFPYDIMFHQGSAFLFDVLQYYNRGN